MNIILMVTFSSSWPIKIQILIEIYMLPAPNKITNIYISIAEVLVTLCRSCNIYTCECECEFNLFSNPASRIELRHVINNNNNVAAFSWMKTNLIWMFFLVSDICCMICSNAITISCACASFHYTTSAESKCCHWNVNVISRKPKMFPKLASSTIYFDSNMNFFVSMFRTNAISDVELTSFSLWIQMLHIWQT